MKRHLSIILTTIGTMLCMLAFCTFAKADVAINEDTFPDEYFRGYVERNFDTDSNDTLSNREIDGVTIIDVSYNKKIQDLTGLKYFTGLTKLNCEQMGLTSLDISENTKLEELNCSVNQLTELDLHANTALKKMWCGVNSLMELDVKSNLELEELCCDGNALLSLDISMCDKLTVLYCENNLLMELTLNEELRELDCSKNYLTKLDLSGCTNITSLACECNRLTELDLSTKDKLKGLNCNSNQLQKLYLYGCTALGTVRCMSNKLTSLDLKTCKNLMYLECFYNQLRNMDVRGCDYLYYLDCQSNLLPALDISQNPGLQRLDCDSNHLSSLDVSQNKKLIYLSCSFNRLKKLIINQNTALTDIYCDSNRLADLDVSTCTSLNRLDCYYNRLTDLKLSSSIYYLYCYSNRLKKIDVSICKTLINFNCSFNQLSDLDVTLNNVLKELSCYSNKITILDLRNCISLNDYMTNTERVNHDNLYDCFKNDYYRKLKFDSFVKILGIDGFISEPTTTPPASPEDIEFAVKHDGMELDSIELEQDAEAMSFYELEISSNADWTAMLTSNTLNFIKLVQSDDSSAIVISDVQAKGAAGASTKMKIQIITPPVEDAISTAFLNFSVGDETHVYSITQTGKNVTEGPAKIIINNITFPDPAFLNKVQEIDENGNNNGYLDQAEIDENESLDVSGLGIKNLTGIEHFSTMTKLECYDNDLKSLDLSRNNHLFTIDCHKNQLESLTLGEQTCLRTLFCYDNQLTELNVTGCPALCGIRCHINHLTYLNVSNCPSLCEELKGDRNRDEEGYDYFRLPGIFIVDPFVKVEGADGVISYPTDDPPFELETEIIEGDIRWENLRYSFRNSEKVFYPNHGLDENGKIPLDIFGLFYSSDGRSDLNMYEHYGTWDGSCNGFAASTILFNYQPQNQVTLHLSAFNVNEVSDLLPTTETKQYKVKNVYELINALQLAQNFTPSTKIFSQAYNAIIYGIEHAQLPIVLIGGEGNGDMVRHAIVAWKIESVSETEKKIYVYDPNTPDDLERFIQVFLNQDGELESWEYHFIGETWEGDLGTEHGKPEFGFTAPDNVISVWNTFLGSSRNVYKVKWITSSYNDNYAIYDSSRKLLGEVKDGKVKSKSSALKELERNSMPADGDPIFFSDSADFQIVNTGSGTLTVDSTGQKQGAFVKTTAKSVILKINDKSEKNEVVINGEANDTFDVTFYSGLESAAGKEKIAISGKSEGTQAEIGLSGSEVVVNNCTDVKITINGEKIKEPETIGKNVNFYKISLEYTEAYYTGKKLKPEIKVKGVKLTKGKDYKLTYKNNKGETDKDTVASVIIQGIGDYTGTKTLQFTIRSNKETKVTKGNFKYAIKNGKAKLTGIKKSKANVKIPDTITVKGKEIPVTEIDAKTFQKNKKLVTLNIGKNVKVIGNNAFSGCLKLKKVTGGAAVITINKDAFSSCKALKSVPEWSGLKSLGANAFKNCVKLTRFNLGAGIKTVEANAFSGCKVLKTLTGGTGVTGIGTNAFSGCVKLSGIPKFQRLTSIGAGAFSGCKAMTKITLPAKLKGIGKKAFYGCSGLKTIEIKTKLLTAKTVGDNAFKGINSKPTVTCPRSMLKVYKKLLIKRGMSGKTKFK